MTVKICFDEVVKNLDPKILLTTLIRKSDARGTQDRRSVAAPIRCRTRTDRIVVGFVVDPEDLEQQSVLHKSELENKSNRSVK